MNLQQVFDTGVRGVLAQGCASMGKDPDGNTTCAYRGENNTKCAIGHCIPDHLYRKDMEGKNILAVLAVSGKLETLLEYENEDLYAFQTCHDDAHRNYQEKDFIGEFKANALLFAKQRNLSTAVLEETHGQ